jgi:hypothetical protein
MKKILKHLVWVLKHGAVNSYYLFRSRQLFDIPISPDYKVGNSSITDSKLLDSYPTLCGLASQDPKLFGKFRSARVMFEALDHVSLDYGNSYLIEILKIRSWTKEFTQVIEKIDSLGSPKKYKFGHYGVFSPTLLRYLKVHLDLEKYFGSLHNLKIVEIGVGFGGQASLTSLLDQPKSYSFCDIPPVLKLVEKFIESLSVPGQFMYIDGRNPSRVNSDLVISNYAFSELSLDVQNLYIENVISNSSRGYLTWNSLSADNLGGHSLADLIRLIPNSQIVPERPNTAEGNVVIIWGSI